MLKICTHNWKLFVEYRIEIELTITFAFYIHSDSTSRTLKLVARDYCLTRQAT
jgi:hypothetical protein